jgi:glycosyltransferase involved in cell wall biosynthesis
LEEFAQLAEECQASGEPWRFLVVGSVPDSFRDFATPLIERLRRARVEVLLDQPPSAVAQRLGPALYAYVPFPDGATAKRSSLLALLECGTIVLTRHGPETPDWIRRCTVHAGTTGEARRRLRQLENSPEERQAALQRVATARKHFDWDAIAQQHVHVYRAILDDDRARRSA